MNPAQKRIFRRLVEDVTAAMIAEALAHRAFLRSPAKDCGVAYGLWREVTRRKNEAQAKLDRAIRAVQSGDLEEQMAATLETMP